MPIRNQIQQQMTAALKQGDKKRLETLRYLWSQIKNKEIDLKRPLTDEEAVKLLQTEAKRRKEAIEAFRAGGRVDLAEKEDYELSVIGEYLPKQLTDEEILAIISSIKAANPNADFGTLIRETMKRAGGRADGRRVTILLKSQL